MPKNTATKLQTASDESYAITQEIGQTGLRYSSGYIHDEFLKELRGQKGVKIIREMLDNEAVIGAGWGTVKQYLRQIDVTVEAGTDDTEGQRLADFVQECLGDMSSTWQEQLTDWLSFGPYGYCVAEIVYKRRGGDSRDPTQRSLYSDGRIGWRKFPIRAQQSITRWEIDDQGGIQGVWQQAAPLYRTTLIPIEKMLLFRTENAGGNPEGRSLFRNAYVSYYMVRRIRQIEAIGVERDLNGILSIGVPGQILRSDASGDDLATRQAFQEMGEKFKMDEQAYVMYPLEYYPGTNNKMFDISLIQNTGRRNHDTTAIIQRYERAEAMALLTDLLLFGHEKTGTYALLKGRQSMFALVLEAFMDTLLAVFNRYAIPRLLELNGMSAVNPPRLVHGEIEAPDLADIGSYMVQLSQAGMDLISDPELRDWALRLANAPVAAEEETEVGKLSRAGLMKLAARELLRGQH